MDPTINISLLFANSQVDGVRFDFALDDAGSKAAYIMGKPQAYTLENWANVCDNGLDSYNGDEQQTANIMVETDGRGVKYLLFGQPSYPADGEITYIKVLAEKMRAPIKEMIERALAYGCVFKE